MKIDDHQESTEPSGPPSVKSLARGLEILSQFDTDNMVLSLVEISRRTGLHRATAYRFVKTLENQGYLIYYPESRLYGIGPTWAMALYALGSATVFADILSDDLQALAKSSRETAALGVRRGDSVQIVHVLPPSRSFVPTLAPNRLHPLDATWNAHCQILLAFASEEKKRRMLAVPQIRHTEHTVVDPKASRARLERVRKEGVAYSREEFQIGTCAVAVPVMFRGQAVAALALIVPVERFTEDAVPGLVEQLRSAVHGMEKRLDSSHDTYLIRHASNE